MIERMDEGIGRVLAALDAAAQRAYALAGAGRPSWHGPDGQSCDSLAA